MADKETRDKRQELLDWLLSLVSNLLSPCLESLALFALAFARIAGRQLGPHQAALDDAQERAPVGRAHDRLLVGARQSDWVALALHALIVDQRVSQVNHRPIFGDPARDLDSGDLAADPHIEEMDQVRAT